MQRKVYYIILHYQAEQMTIDCVNSILDLKYDPNISVDIVIVDNFSPNESGKSLFEKYKYEKNIHVILAKENLGFARGNNLGFAYAKKNGADFIVQMNNDMIIEDKLFNASIISIFEREKYGVLGPSIFCPNEEIYQNPAQGFKYSLQEVNKKLLRAKFLRFLNSINIYDLLKQNLVKPSNVPWENSLEITIDSCRVLHGSCLIFSPLYISQNDGINESTFMYYEENILAYECFIKNIKMYYSNELTVLHFRKIATKSIMGNKQKNEFFYKHSIDSLNTLKKIMQENNEV